MPMLYLSRNQIAKFHPCKDGWNNLVEKTAGTYADDDPIPFSKLLEIYPVQDVIWAFRCNWEEGRELYLEFLQGCVIRAKGYASYDNYASYDSYDSYAAANTARYAANTANAARYAANTAASYDSYHS